MSDIAALVRENIRKLTPYSSARSEYKGANGIFLDANENPWGRYNRYPDPFQVKLKEKIAQEKGVQPNQLFLSNGSDNIVDMTYRVFCEPQKDKALTFPPTFGMYTVAAGINNVELLKIPLDTNFLIDRPRLEEHISDKNLKVIFLCSPNNPTGNLMAKEDIDYILDNFKGIVVIDEAYIDFSTCESYIKQLGKYPHLIILQTMSKAWGMAGARIGMAIANEDIVAFYNKVKTPYNISTLNQEAAITILENGLEDFKKRKKITLEEKEKVRKALQNLDCVQHIYHSDTNFLLVEMKNASAIYEKLTQENIIVRNQDRVVKNCLRITIGLPEENEKLIRLLSTL